MECYHIDMFNMLTTISYSCFEMENYIYFTIMSML